MIQASFTRSRPRRCDHPPPPLPIVRVRSHCMLFGVVQTRADTQHSATLRNVPQHRANGRCGVLRAAAECCGRAPMVQCKTSSSLSTGSISADTRGHQRKVAALNGNVRTVTTNNQRSDPLSTPANIIHSRSSTTDDGRIRPLIRSRIYIHAALFDTHVWPSS